MKTIMLGLALLGFVGPALAVDKAELDNRIRMLTAKLQAMQQRPDRRIPVETLRKAHGVILLDRTKAGFIFAYQGGSGVALVKDAKSGKWSPAAFLSANEASLGFQVGGQQSFVVILLMGADATRLLSEPSFKFGGEARGTAGNATAGAEGTVPSTEQAVLIYGDRKGLFGGAAIKGDMLSSDADANAVYYGRFLTARDILFDHKVKATETASELARKITDYSAKAPHYSENSR